ncbi:MAG: hypothetical protein ACOC0Z_04060 [Halohasta sp.]
MRYRSAIGGGIVVSGVLLVVLQVLQYRYFPASSTELLFNTVPFVMIALAICFTGVTIVREEQYDDHAALIATWGVGGAVGFVAVFTLLTFGIVDHSGVGLLIGTVDAGGAGGLAGLLVGLYDAQSRQTLATVETFAEKLKGLNRYGKALNESNDPHAISSLCIEVVEVVLRSHGSAFLLQEDEGFEVVNTTLTGDEIRDVLVEVSKDLTAGEPPEPLTVVRDEDGFDRIRSGEPGTTLAIRIPAGDTSALLFSVYYDTDSVDAADIDLLELLAAHTSTTL